eukprot:GHVO01018078.1.p1 GENE.GHVO01018078.1~~GHVO01018078.1.p1  ORF type:complete len:758 (-),score=94.23 GHVO01018078.1:107-2062(-)
MDSISRRDDRIISNASYILIERRKEHQALLEYWNSHILEDLPSHWKGNPSSMDLLMCINKYYNTEHIISRPQRRSKTRYSLAPVAAFFQAALLPFTSIPRLAMTSTTLAQHLTGVPKTASVYEILSDILPEESKMGVVNPPPNTAEPSLNLSLNSANVSCAFSSLIWMSGIPDCIRYPIWSAFLFPWQYGEDNTMEYQRKLRTVSMRLGSCSIWGVCSSSQSSNCLRSDMEHGKCPNPACTVCDGHLLTDLRAFVSAMKLIPIELLELPIGFAVKNPGFSQELRYIYHICPCGFCAPSSEITTHPSFWDKEETHSILMGSKLPGYPHLPDHIKPHGRRVSYSPNGERYQSDSELVTKPRRKSLPEYGSLEHHTNSPLSEPFELESERKESKRIFEGLIEIFYDLVETRRTPLNISLSTLALLLLFCDSPDIGNLFIDPRNWTDDRIRPNGSIIEHIGVCVSSCLDYIFNNLAYEYFPQICESFRALQVSSSQYLPLWIRSLFVNSPIPTAHIPRIWDALFFTWGTSKEAAIVATSLAILQYYEKQLLSSGYEDMILYLHGSRRTTWNVDTRHADVHIPSSLASVGTPRLSYRAFADAEIFDVDQFISSVRRFFPVSLKAHHEYKQKQLSTPMGNAFDAVYRIVTRASTDVK